MQILLKKRYVVGIIFDDQNNVLLINKLRPDTQKGMLNGIGGKIEKNETPIEAIIRECKEETNLNIKRWKLFDEMKFDDVEIYFYYSKVTNKKILKYKSLTDEQLELCDINNLPTNTMNDIKQKILFIVKNYK